LGVILTIHSVIGLGLVLGLGLAGVVSSAGEKLPLALLASAAFVNVVLAAVGIATRRSLIARAASRSAVESASARAMALVWLWGAAALVLVYTLKLSWREWLLFTSAFTIAGLLSLGFSALLAKDAALKRDDETLLRLGRYLAIGQLAGMIVTIAGLVIDPDKEFLYPVDNDWAGNGIFLFGALALAALSAHALIDRAKKST
jgi:protein-S-isoprenylcysteine O-methyltransferase Ste14